MLSEIRLSYNLPARPENFDASWKIDYSNNRSGFTTARALETCRFTDGSLLRSSPTDSNWYKAYQYWMADYEDNPRVREIDLKRDAPNEIDAVGNYLWESYMQHSIQNHTPSRPVMTRSQTTICIAGIVSLIALITIIALAASGKFK